MNRWTWVFYVKITLWTKLNLSNDHPRPTWFQIWSSDKTRECQPSTRSCWKDGRGEQWPLLQVGPSLGKTKIVNSCQHLRSLRVVDVQMMWHHRMKKYWTRWHCLLCRSGARLIDYVLVWEEKSEVKRDICFPWEKSFENRKKGDCIFFQDSTNLDHSDKRATYITKVWLCRNYVIC